MVQPQSSDMTPDLEKFVERAVERVLDTGETPAEAARHLLGEGDPGTGFTRETRAVLVHVAVTAFVNAEMVRYRRSGRTQSVRTQRRPLVEEMAGLKAYDRTLMRLVFMGADGRMKSVLDFDREDAEAVYGRRVERLREVADREEPFWKAVLAATADGTTPGEKTETERRGLAALAVEAQLADPEPEEEGEAA